MTCCWPGCERVSWEKLAPLCLGHINDVVTAHTAWVDGLDIPAATHRHPGWLYFVKSGDLCKIGWTRDLWQRMKAYPPTAEVLAVMPGSRDDEGRLHKRFGHLLARGREWFHPEQALLDYISGVVDEHGPIDDLHCGPATRQHARP